MGPCKCGERIVNEIEKKNNEVTLVAGVINATGKMLYWKCDFEINIGDYAIVQNMNGHDLIKVVGLVKTTKNTVGRFSNTNYENMKEVISSAEGILE